MLLSSDCKRGDENHILRAISSIGRMRSNILRMSIWGWDQAFEVFWGEFKYLEGRLKYLEVISSIWREGSSIWIGHLGVTSSIDKRWDQAFQEESLIHPKWLSWTCMFWEVKGKTNRIKGIHIGEWKSTWLKSGGGCTQLHPTVKIQTAQDCDPLYSVLLPTIISTAD